MLGKLHNRLPIVYASAAPREREHKYSIRVGTLSRALAGMAHVIVEPSRHFSFALSRHVAGLNAFGGAVSVYWPNNAAQEVRFLPQKFDDTRQLEDAIVDVV